MFSNLFYRLSIWWGDILGWDHKRTTKRRKYQNLRGGQDD